jgi:uncharacterized protein (DUF305 family)
LILPVLTCIAVLLSVFAVRAEGPIEGRAGRAEVRFLEGMIDHHQMALDMANDCLTKATTENVLTTCQNVIDAQTAEIKTMQEWLLTWYNISYTPMSLTDLMALMDKDGMSSMDSMAGMPVTDPAMMMGMFAGLNRLEGVAYDTAWTEAMIDHHDDAIHMSERLLTRDPEGTGHAELRELAQKIITDQTAEIEAMEMILTDLAG